MPGELHFAGPCIARGYLSQPELTGEKFVQDPFAPAQRMYKTGDVVRWRGDGELVFVGRADHQVKVRGFRIELGDIESAVRAAGGAAVGEVVVDVDASRGAGAERLVAHVGASSAASSGGAARALERHLIAECAKRLPAYMVPSLVVPYEKLPRNANGKVDRKALVIPRQEVADVAGGEGAEEVDLSATESDIREVWAGVLNRPAHSVRLEDSFFAALGGNSLLAGRVTAQLRRKFAVDLPGTTMYTHSTIKRLAAQVDQLRSEETSSDEDKLVLRGGGRPKKDQKPRCVRSAVRQAASSDVARWARSLGTGCGAPFLPQVPASNGKFSDYRGESCCSAKAFDTLSRSCLTLPCCVWHVNRKTISVSVGMHHAHA